MGRDVRKVQVAKCLDTFGAYEVSMQNIICSCTKACETHITYAPRCLGLVKVLSICVVLGWSSFLLLGCYTGSLVVRASHRSWNDIAWHETTHT
jgi:hypothetical protein